MRLLLLLLALGLAFVLWPRPTEAPKEAGVRLYGVAFHLFPEEEGVEWRFRAEEMVEEEGRFRVRGGFPGGGTWRAGWTCAFSPPRWWWSPGTTSGPPTPGWRS